MAFACASAIVAARSLAFLACEGLHFDSDQAVFGLMAKHLSEGRALPLYMYGQRYLLAVSVWLAAPFVALWGCQVFALKLPQLLLNVVVCALLLERLVTEVRLSPRVPPVGLVAAALMVETRRGVRLLIGAALCVLAGANAWDYARLAVACARRPPASPYRALANELAARGVRTGVAPYLVGAWRTFGHSLPAVEDAPEVQA